MSIATNIHFLYNRCNTFCIFHDIDSLVKSLVFACVITVSNFILIAGPKWSLCLLLSHLHKIWRSLYCQSSRCYLVFGVNFLPFCNGFFLKLSVDISFSGFPLISVFWKIFNNISVIRYYPIVSLTLLFKKTGVCRRGILTFQFAAGSFLFYIDLNWFPNVYRQHFALMLISCLFLFLNPIFHSWRVYH